MLNVHLSRLTKRYSIFLIFFISYLFLFLFSIVFSIFNYSTFVNEISEQRSQYDRVIFRQLDEMINAKIDRVDALLLDIITDVDIMQTTGTRNLISRNQLSKTTIAAAHLRNHYNKSQISRVYLYYRDSKVLIMNETYYQPAEFYRRYINSELISYQAWLNKLDQDHSRDFERSLTQNQGTLSLYQSISDGRSQGAQVVIEFDIHDIYRAFNASLSSESMTFYLMDENDICLFSYGAENLEKQGGHFLEPHVSEQTGWTYHSAIPANLYNKGLYDIIKRTGLMIGIELLFGILLCFIFALSNSSPIRKLYRRLIKPDTKKSQTRNEYYLVDTYFNNLLEEKDELVHQYNQAMKNSLIQSLLTGTLPCSETEGNYLNEIGIHFIGSDFQVANIQIEYADNESVNMSIEQQSLMKYHLISQLSESFQQRAVLYFSDLSWNQIAIIINGNNLPQWLDDLYQVLNDIKNSFEGKYQSYLTIGIGGVYQSINSVFISHQESIAALEYRILRGQGCVSTYQDVCTGEISGYYPVINKSQIKAKICVGDAKGATTALDMIIADIFSKRDEIPLEIAKCLFFDIMSIGFDVMSEIKPDDSIQSDYKALLFECKTIDQLQATLNLIFSEICISVTSRKHSHNQKLLDRIRSYMENHFTEQSFSLVMLADHLDITAPYLSSFFKEQVGVNFMDYLTTMRIEKACTYILDTNMSITDIAESIGYASSGSFIRTFKKVQGITPNHYRELHVPMPSLQ